MVKTLTTALRCSFASLLVCASVAAADSPATQLERVANRFVEQQLTYDPTLSYSTGLPTKDHSRFPDRTPQALAASDAAEQSDLEALNSIDVGALPAGFRATYAVLKEQLESDLQLRVCKAELWNVNHFDGWGTMFAQVAEHQPVASPDDRAQAITRWSTAPRYIDVEIANLRRGLAAGYSAPRSVVRRVIQQMDGLTSVPADKSPFYSPASRASDATFQAAFAQLITDQVNPALKRYRTFLERDYLPHAREGVAISDLPDGPDCYQAFLRSNTTLNRTPQEVFDLGRATVAANEAEISVFGRKLLGISEFSAIVTAVKTRPESHFHSRDELLAFSRDLMARAKAQTAAKVIDQLPKQDAVIQPERDFEEAAGVSSHFDAEPDTSKPAIFWIQLNEWASITRGEAAITVVHEAWPGHHLQIALARELVPNSPLSQLVSNAAYAEGWARYAEAMSEEVGIYPTDDAPILRRIWPARGMVVDPGLHALHWTRQQAIDYLVATGRFTPSSADDLVDRIAVMPGQLTSYDSGGLEIKALRHAAQTSLGDRFDLRKFNRVVLEEGVVPLRELRSHVEQWISAMKH